MARFYVLSLEPTLFGGDVAPERECGGWAHAGGGSIYTGPRQRRPRSSKLGFAASFGAAIGSVPRRAELLPSQ